MEKNRARARSAAGQIKADAVKHPPTALEPSDHGWQLPGIWAGESPATAVIDAQSSVLPVAGAVPVALAVASPVTTSDEPRPELVAKPKVPMPAMTGEAMPFDARLS